MSETTNRRKVCPACGWDHESPMWAKVNAQHYADTGRYLSCESHDHGAVRLAMDAGRVRTWADGFGRWYASVPESMAFPMGVAKMAIRLELQERAARGETVPMPRVERAPDYDDTGDTSTLGSARHAYREVTP